MIGTTESKLRDYERKLRAWKTAQEKRHTFAAVIHEPRPAECGLSLPYQLWAAEQVRRAVLAATHK